MTLPNPIANNSTEAYLAYKAGVLEVGGLKPSLYSPYLHFDAWLAYWCGLTDTYPLNKNNEPEMLTDEEALVAYLAGVTNTYPEEMQNPNDVRIVGYLRYLVSVKYGRPAAPLTNAELYLSMMHPSIISNITPSADFVLDGTAEYPLLDLKLYGDTFQQTYSGKNLYTPTNMSQTRYGIDFGSNGTRMTFNNTSTGNVFGQTYFNMNGTEWAGANYANYDASTSGLTLPAGTYTISLHNFSGSFTSNYAVYVRVCKASSTVPNSTVASIDLKTSATSATFTLAQETTIKVQFVVGLPSEGTMPTFNLYSFDIQIEQGSQATSFEPYTGGVPVPNPDSPQGIHVVTGEQTVAVTGKNLCGPAAWRAVSTGGGYPVPYQSAATIESSDDNSVVFNVPNTYGGAESCFIPVKAGEVYTVSFNGDNLPSRFFITQYNSSKTRVATLNYSSVGQLVTTTVTATNDGYITVAFAATATSGTYDISDIQVEKSATASSYKPYQGQSYTVNLGSIELCKIGDYQDYIYKSGDDWYVHKETGKIVLNGSEDWERIPYTVTQVYYRWLNSSISTEDGFCNYLDVAPTSASIVNVENSIRANGTFIGIRFTPSFQPSIEDFKTWLSNNNLLFYYTIATPTDTKITDSTLVSQLEAIIAGGSYDGTTHVVVTASGENLPSLLLVVAAKG